LGTGFSVTWTTAGGVSADETVFSAGFSNNGGQGGPGATYAAAITPNGCQVLNTATGVFTSTGTLPSGTVPNWTTVTDVDGFTIHNVKMAKDGSYLIITPTLSSCSGGWCSAATQSMFFWQIGTTNVVKVNNSADGHWTEGYSHWINSGSSGQFRSRLFSNPTAVTNIIPSSLLPAGIVSVYDKHCGWTNVDAANSYPFFCSTYTTNNPVPNVAWYNEIIGISPTTGQVYRFAHTFATARSHRFNDRSAIGAISQDGRFFAWSSDWMGTLGSESGASTCTVGVDCRGDVFVVELQ
jgi:hypothetical protein